jgi:hypothetical protein
MTKLILSLLFLLTLAGCKSVTFENGEVPSAYLSYAKKLEGTYRGSFNGVSTDLIFEINGNRPTLRALNGQRNDLLSDKCQSSIGQILSAEISGSGSSAKIKTAVFKFNPNNCISIEGDDLSLSLDSSQTKASVSILDRTEYERQCTIEGGNPVNGVPPREVCNTVPKQYFLNGKFNRL